jgi:hypothetical protein
MQAEVFTGKHEVGVLLLVLFLNSWVEIGKF